MGRARLTSGKTRDKEARSFGFLGLREQLQEAMKEVGATVFRLSEAGLDEAADYLLDELIKDTPEGETGKLKSSWVRTNKYKGVRYIQNTALRWDKKTGRNHAYLNYVEFGKKGKPFARATFERVKPKLTEIMIDKLKDEKEWQQLSKRNRNQGE